VERLVTAILQKRNDYACFLYVHIHPTESDYSLFSVAKDLSIDGWIDGWMDR